MMRKFLICLLVSVFTLSIIQAQQITRFAYIQTENKQPFYVKWNSKVWSSSSSGYLILSKIKDQQINVVVGFPKNIYPEQSFTITFSGNKDAGFLLKEFGEKGWGLYNLQSFAVSYAVKEATAPKEEVVTAPVVNPPKVEEAKSPFGDLLVQVTQDSTVKNIAVEKLQPPVVKKEEPIKPKIDSVQKIVKQEEKPLVKESPKTNNAEIKPVANDAVKKDVVEKIKTSPDVKTVDEKPKVETKPAEKEVVKTETKTADSVKTAIQKEVKQVAQDTVVKVQPVAEAVKSSVNLFATNENAESYDYIYVTEEKTGVKDTVGISIKKDKVEIKPVVKSETEVKDTIKPQPKDEPKFIEIIADTSRKANEVPVIESIKKDTLENKIDSVVKEPAKELIKDEKPLTETKKEATTVTESAKETPKEAAKVVMVNTDCKNMATEKDFMALRKKMVAEENDDDMVAAARKVFKTKCFTTDQVKNLCVLFLKDEGKYKFLDAAYPYVYDTDNFKQLSFLLTEEYYINRFKVMIKN